MFGHGHGLPGEHRLVDGARSVFDDAVDRNLLAGTDAQAVAHQNVVEADVDLTSVRLDAARLRRCEAEQRLEGGAGSAARAELEDLSEQDQRDDDRGRLEVQADLSVMVAERRREEPWRDHGDDAVGERDADPEADQRPHVQAPVAQRRSEADEEGPRRPDADRRGERELDVPACAADQAERDARHGPHDQDQQW
jgi:hypothetical protein